MQNATSKLCSAHGIAKWLTTIKNAMPNACLTQETKHRLCRKRKKEKKKGRGSFGKQSWRDVDREQWNRWATANSRGTGTQSRRKPNDASLIIEFQFNLSTGERVATRRPINSASNDDRSPPLISPPASFFHSQLATPHDFHRWTGMYTTGHLKRQAAVIKIGRSCYVSCSSGVL